MKDLETLNTGFNALANELAGVVEGLRAGFPPPEGLIGRITGAAAQFTDLKARVLAAAAGVEPSPAPGAVASVADLTRLADRVTALQQRVVELLDLVGRIGARLAPGSELVFDAYSPAGAWLTNALIRLTGLTEPGVLAGGDDVRALRAAAPTLVPAEARDLFAEPTPAGVGAWTHLQVALSRWVRFTTLYAYTVPPCPPPTS